MEYRGQKFTWVRKRGCRRLILRPEKVGFRLTTPYFCFQRSVEKFIDEHWAWIEKHQQEAQEAPALLFQEGGEIEILGQKYRIQRCERGATRTESDVLWVAGDSQFTARRVGDFVRKETLAYISTKAEEYAALLGVRVGRITLRDTTSRWGSCSSRRSLSFCWKLGLAPVFVVDYLVAHEVAHLAEMNHSESFWRVVGSLPVQRADAEIWLRKNGRKLLAN